MITDNRIQELLDLEDIEENESKFKSEFGYYPVNALLGCHDLALSCCHEIARISVMECSQ